MICAQPKPVYLPHSQGGINLAISRGDGITICVEWDKAYPSTSEYALLYNIYFSSILEDVFTEGVKYIALDDGYINACISGLTPGDTYYFAVKASQYVPDWFNPLLLPDGITDLKTLPDGMLLSDINTTDVVIPVSDIELFPAYGVVQVGTELIRYFSKDISSDSLLVSERGFLDTNIRFHQTDGYDGYHVQDPLVKFWKGFEDDNFKAFQETTNFQYPNQAFTALDGYATNTDKLQIDESASDNDLADFPQEDFVGWHRTSPTDITSGRCIGSYMGGEQWCADGYLGVGRQTRGLPLNEQIARREEVLLSVTGEAVVFVRRFWDGVRCPCVLQTVERPEKRCLKCFVPGTLVRSEFGWKSIEDIIIGEKVLSSDGKYHKVTETYANYYEGDLIGINTSISGTTIFSTPEHPFLTMRGDHRVARSCGPKCDVLIKNGDGYIYPYDIRQLPSKRWHARITYDGKRIALGSFDSRENAVYRIDRFREEHDKSSHEIKWDFAENITTGDWLVPRWNKDINDICEIEIPPKFRKNTNLGSQRLGSDKFIVDEEFLWMIGMYIAEGSCGDRTVTFALHIDEVDYQNRLIAFFKNNGYNPTIYANNSEKGVVVAVNSTTLSQWLPTWLGKYCYNKQIPEELMQLPNNKAWALIRGIYDGDGTKSFNSIGQTSKVLALQLVELLHRVGEQPLLRLQTSNVLTPNGNKRKQCYVVNWAESTLTHNNRKYRWNFNGDLLTQVKSVSIMPYSGKVYNLEVEDDHTYIVQGVVAHNCFNTGFITGYQQFFNPRRSDGRILVRFEPAEEDIKFENAGLESFIIYNCWTLPFPIIKDWDFMIRYDITGAEEFRYEVLGVTRNSTFEGNQGAQRFRLQRVRKTSPIYQWRAIASTATLPAIVTTGIGIMPGPGNTLLPHTHQIVINEGIVSLSQINQTTSVSESHNHQVHNGVVMPELGHTHIIIL